MTTHKYKGKLGVVEITTFNKKEGVSPVSQNIYIVCLFVAVLVATMVLLVSGFSLTIIQGKKYAALAENNTLRKEAVFGERGLIIDRNGTPLVSNKKSYDIFIDKDSVKKEQALAALPEMSENIEKEYADAKKQGNIRVVHDAPKELVLKLRQQPKAGITVRESIVREYLNAVPFAHVLGYTGIASEEDLASNSSYVKNQIVGKTGLEYQYDKQLEGGIEYQTIAIDALGNIVDHSAAQKPQAGNTLVLSIDKRYQEVFYNLLKKTVDKNKAKGGAAVLLDIHTGEVVALASYPSFDSNLFVKGISYDAYNKLIQSPQTPLLSRAIAAQEPPGSTFKTIVAAAGLETGAIAPNTTYYASGIIKLEGGLPFQDYNKRVYGTLAVRDALMVSSNIFFCRTILKLGMDKFLPYANAFGIGLKTGIDLPAEAAGRLPSPENKIALARAGAYWLDPVWYPEGDSCNSSIGQGITLATPLQMANVAAAIANGGTLYKPFVVKKTITVDGKETPTQPIALSTNIASENSLQVVREGMRMSVNGPRAVITSLKYVPQTVAAKTGTAEFGVKDKHGYSTTHAWVIGFYPYDKPKYAFAVMIESGGSSSVASFMMRDFLNTIK